MAMADNMYLFREGYEREEMIDRIRVARFRSIEDRLVQEILEEAELEPSYLQEHEKWDFLEEIQEQVGQERFEEFLSDMFDRYGEKGDRFNLQFYVVDGLVQDTLVDRAEAVEGEDLTQIEDEDFRRPTTLIAVQSDRDAGVVDLQFEVVDYSEDIDAEGLEMVYTQDGEFIDVSETELEEAERLIRENRYMMEVRAYIEDGLVAVSNSVGRDPIRREMKDAVKRWGIES